MNNDTRPGEFGTKVQNELDFRVEVLSGLAEIKALFAAHEKEDERRFTELGSNVKSVTSSVEQQSQEGRFSLKQLVIGALIALSTLGGWVIAIFFHGGKP